MKKLIAPILAGFLTLASFSASSQTRFDLGTQARYGATNWTSSSAFFPGSITQTYNAGTLNSGAGTNLNVYGVSFTGNADGTTSMQNVVNNLATQGVNGITGATNFRNVLTHGVNVTLGTAIANSQGISVSGAGNVTTAVGSNGTFSLSSSGNIANADYFRASTPTLSSTGAVTGTLTGFRVINIGNALVNTVEGVKIDDITNSTNIRGIRSAVSSGTGKYNIYADGTAPNYYAGQVYLGGTVDLFSTALQIAGTTTTTSSAGTGRFSNDANPPTYFLFKSRGVSLGGATIVQNGDNLGQIIWQGTNGTGYTQAATITAAVDGTPGAANDMPGRLVFQTTPDGSGTPTEAMRIDNAQRIITGANVNQNGAKLQINGIDGSTSQALAQRWSADTGGPELGYTKSRGASIGTNTIVQNGDTIGVQSARGANGTGYDTAAQIIFQVDGTPGASTDMPGRIVFTTTPDGSATPTERWRIDNTGNLIAGQAKIPLRGTGAGASQLAVLQTTAPTCSSNCGTSPSVAGSDTAMTVTMGATGAPASGFVITFNGTWAAAPSCVGAMALTGMANTKLPLTIVTTTTTMTVVTNGAAPANSDKYHFHCMGVS